MSTSKAQKEKVLSEFMSLTNAIPADTARICKKAGYRLEAAIDAFYRDFAAQANAERAVKSRQKSLSQEIEGLLDAQFKLYRDEDNPTKIEMDGLIRYLEDLGISPEEPSVLCLSHLVSAPRLGIIDQVGFIKSWKSIYLEQQRDNSSTSTSGGSTNENHEKVKTLEELIEFEKEHLFKLSEDLGEDVEYFTTVYQFVFNFAKDEGQKSFALDTAIAFWEMLMPIAPVSGDVPFKAEYLQWWFELLRGKGKAVSRDQWNMFWDFVEQFDDGFEKFDEAAAWPSVIDDYVALAREKLKAQSMDTS